MASPPNRGERGHLDWLRILYRAGKLPRDRWLKEVGRHRDRMEWKARGRTCDATHFPDIIGDGVLIREPAEAANPKFCRSCSKLLHLAYSGQCLDCLGQ